MLPIVTKMDVPGGWLMQKYKGSVTKGACAVLEVAVNAIFVSIGDGE